MIIVLSKSSLQDSNLSCNLFHHKARLIDMFLAGGKIWKNVIIVAKQVDAVLIILVLKNIILIMINMILISNIMTIMILIMILIVTMIS